ncbi:MAG: hypothetical protein JKY94_08440 [Rhodobacteraceae bacterium]|nr:hypothetical protein [Paracoccaceae bacterium]
MASEIIETPEDTSYDEELFGVRSDRGLGLEVLEYWLDKEFWNFDRGFCQFDGYSEGHCILAGIDPERSTLAAGQYGPQFLPDSIILYGYEKIAPEEERYLKEAVDHHVDDLKSLGLKGRVHCHVALEICARNKLDPPWLDAANNDFECAKRLPASLRTNDAIIRRISRGASSKGGSNRAKKNSKTQMLDTIGLRAFEKLREKKFPNCIKKSSREPNARAIADKIYHVLIDSIENSEDPLPEIPTIESRVRVWLKNSAK